MTTVTAVTPPSDRPFTVTLGHTGHHYNRFLITSDQSSELSDHISAISSSSTVILNLSARHFPSVAGVSGNTTTRLFLPSTLICSLVSEYPCSGIAASPLPVTGWRPCNPARYPSPLISDIHLSRSTSWPVWYFPGPLLPAPCVVGGGLLINQSRLPFSRYRPLVAQFICHWCFV